MNTVIVVVLALIVIVILTIVLLPGVVYQAAMRAERALARLNTRSITIDGIEFSYTDSNDGVPLVLLHGFTADKDHWTRVARYLTKKFRVIAPDLPGFGRSTRDPGLDYSVRAQVERLQTFVDQLGLEQFHLGGSSMGGAIAAVFAAGNPQRVLSLWLLAPAGVVTDHHSEMEQILLSGLAHPLIPANRQQFEDTLKFVFVKSPFLPGPLRRYLARDMIGRQALHQQIFADLLDDTGGGQRDPINALVDGLAVPTLVVWGEGDRVLDPSGAVKLGELLSHAVVEMLPDTGHLPMLECPQRVANDFLRFQTANVS